MLTTNYHNPGLRKIYPTKAHEAVTKKAIDFLSGFSSVETFILTCSCARGLGTRDIDYAVLVRQGTSLETINSIETQWLLETTKDPIFRSFKETAPFYNLDLWVTDGQFRPRYQPHLLSHGPDTLELCIGNLFIHSQPLAGNMNYFMDLKNSWLPYYDDELRKQRLAEARQSALYSLEYVAWDHQRGHHYLALTRLLTALEYFIHGIFILKSVYPIAYDKWLQDQFKDLLQMPDLYEKIIRLLVIPDLSSQSLCINAENLGLLVKTHLKYI